MDTPDDSPILANEGTMPDEVAGLDVEVQAMYERIRGRLGLHPTQRESLGRYELRGGRIGSGGMGSVYRAYDSELDRDVAVKVVSTRALTNLAKLRERLRREAKLLAKLEHAHVVRVYDAGVDQGRVYLTMELVEGQTLRERQANAAHTEVLRWYIEAGRGLAAIHAQGIVHRDFKPDNVFVGDDGHARVGDFGLAYFVGESDSDRSGEGGDEDEEVEQPSRLTQAGEVLGTLGYMAPEQLRGDRPNARSDQYSYCVSLWEALAGIRPYEGENRDAYLAAMQSATPRGEAEIGRRLRRALRIGLSGPPEQRHADMDTLVEVLTNELRRQLERKRRILRNGAFGVLVAATLGASIFGWSYYRAANPECELAEEVLALRSSTTAWASFPANTRPRMEGYLDKLELDARDACTTRDVALEQRSARLLNKLKLKLESLPDSGADHLDEFMIEFERGLVGSPPLPLSSDTDAFIRANIAPREESWDLPGIIQVCDEALETKTLSKVDRSELLLRRGRARSLDGHPALAVADFKQARALSTDIGDLGRQLEANLAAAKTSIMRREQIDAAAELADIATDQIDAAKELRLSPRRTDLLELSASIAKHRGQLDEALALQYRVVGRRALVGAPFELVTALVNLGSIHEARGDSIAAERSYRLALRVDPEDLEAAVNLGTLLVNQNRDLDEARVLLEQVEIADYPDLELFAATVLLQLELTAKSASEVIAERRKNLVTLLRSHAPATPTHIRQAWIFVVIAHAVAGEFDHEFEEALRELPEPESEDQQIERAELELDIALALSPERREQADDLLRRALARLEALPFSVERDDSILEIRQAQTSSIASP